MYVLCFSLDFIKVIMVAICKFALSAALYI